MRKLLDRFESDFHPGGKWEKLYPLFEAIDTFLYKPKSTTKNSSHVRDNIDLKRVYSTGMSNGGYMSYRLACDLSFKTAAIASVTGSMTPETFNTCSPNHPTAVLQIHGDVDGVVPYYGDWKGRSIPDVMNYWKNYNDCQIEDISTVLDVNEDGDGGFFFLYDQCLADIQSELYLMTNMGHEWPRFSNGNDINAAQVIWQFFSQYDIDGRINE